MSGNVEMALGLEGGMVTVKFHEPTEWIKFEPQNAIDFACALTDRAFEARDGVKPAGETLKAELIERHRMTLTQRVARMLSTLRHDPVKTNGTVAQEVVDACLREVF